MKTNRRSKARLLLMLMLIVAFIVPACVSAFAETEAPSVAADGARVVLDAEAPADDAQEPVDDAAAPADEAAATDAKFTLGEGEDAVDYDLSDGDSAHAYVDSYADNLEADPDFKTHVSAAIAKVRESVKTYATFWALLPPIVAIALALITKEVYSSLIIGIIVGGVLYAGGNFEGTINHVISDGFVSNVADSYNMGILLFLILLGALVSMMNKAGGSAAFGRWATKHIKTRVGAQIATICLGVLIFIDDYFNCLTVGSVMRP
ncbi:MAG: hypothetical protein ACI4XE_08625, partial [Acutalibacteraceae bacterium]